MLKIKEDIYWVGYIDWELRNFHGYSTPSGSTYNAYLVLDQKPTLANDAAAKISESLKRSSNGQYF